MHLRAGLLAEIPPLWVLVTAWVPTLIAAPQAPITPVEIPHLAARS